MIGQSFDGKVIKEIANRFTYTFMKVKTTATKEAKKVTSYNISSSGQLELILS
jgi:DNA (cytosine-5)-methyltransferase 1